MQKLIDDFKALILALIISYRVRWRHPNFNLDFSGVLLYPSYSPIFTKLRTFSFVDSIKVESVDPMSSSVPR